MSSQLDLARLKPRGLNFSATTLGRLATSLEEWTCPHQTAQRLALVVVILVPPRLRHRPSPGDEEDGAEDEDEDEAEAEAVVGLQATRKARALLREPAKRPGRMARTRRSRLIKRSGSEACLHETVSARLLLSLQAPECPESKIFSPPDTFFPCSSDFGFDANRKSLSRSSSETHDVWIWGCPGA